VGSLPYCLLVLIDHCSGISPVPLHDLFICPNLLNFCLIADKVSIVSAIPQGLDERLKMQEIEQELSNNSGSGLDCGLEKS